jgi:hypothetical protein
MRPALPQKTINTGKKCEKILYEDTSEEATASRSNLGRRGCLDNSKGTGWIYRF